MITKMKRGSLHKNNSLSVCALLLFRSLSLLKKSVFEEKKKKTGVTSVAYQYKSLTLKLTITQWVFKREMNDKKVKWPESKKKKEKRN